MDLQVVVVRALVAASMEPDAAVLRSVFLRRLLVDEVGLEKVASAVVLEALAEVAFDRAENGKK